MYETNRTHDRKIGGKKHSSKLVDLAPETTSKFVFPTYDNSLKSIAKCLGFTWRQADVDARESIVLYLDYLKDKKTNQKNLKMIKEYNEDDCRATLIIKDWLVKKG